MKRLLTAITILLLATQGVAQETEALRDLEQGHALRLEEYNTAFVQRQTYFASRSRIVKVDTDLLLQDRNITIMPFEGSKPIELTWAETRREGPDVVTWVGTLSDDPFGEFRATGVATQVKINLLAWDLDEAGTALVSTQNRFEYDPAWTFDSSDNPVLESAPGVGAGVAVTPPPTTPEAIERHKRLKSLNKHAFYSVFAVLEMPEARYVLEPLQFTPRYSVIYEIPRETVLPLKIDRQPGEPEFDSDQQRLAFEKYRAMTNRLPKEDSKEIKGDIQ